MAINICTLWISTVNFLDSTSMTHTCVLYVGKTTYLHCFVWYETWSLTINRKLQLFVKKEGGGECVDKRLNIQWQKFHNQEPPDLYSPPRTVRVVKSGYDMLNTIIFPYKSSSISLLPLTLSIYIHIMTQCWVLYLYFFHFLYFFKKFLYRNNKFHTTGSSLKIFNQVNL